MPTSFRTPPLEAVINKAIDLRIEDFHTMMPGVVVKYYPAEQTADVRPTILEAQRKVQTADSPLPYIHEPYPILHKVPVMFQRAGSMFISFNVNPGDSVAIFFSEKDLSNWDKSNGNDFSQEFLHHHGDYRNAFAVPGLYPAEKRKLANSETSGIKIGSDTEFGMLVEILEQEVTIFSGGDPVAKFESGGEDAGLTIGGPGVNNAMVSAMIAEKMQVMWEALSLWLAGHTHTSATPGNPTSPPVQAPALELPPITWDDTSRSSKVKFPDG